MKSQDRFDSLFAYFANIYKLPPPLLKAQVAVESSFDPEAVSPAGAVGLAQFMPRTWEEWQDGIPGSARLPGLPENPPKDPRNPEHAIKAQAAYLSYLLQYFGSERKALAAYNWGMGNVRKAIGKFGGVGWSASGPPALRARGRRGVVDAEGTERSSRAVGVHATPHEGDVASTHNGLRSHGHGRCLVISRTHVARLPVNTYRRRLGNVEMRGPLAKWAVKQRGAKNGESENPETKTWGGRAQPPWLHAAPQVELANRRIEEHVGRGVTPWKSARYDEAPKGSPSGASR